MLMTVCLEQTLLMKLFSYINSNSKRYPSTQILHYKATQYIIATYPFNDDLLRHASFWNRVNIGFDSVEYFVSCYPHLHGLTVPREIN